MPIPPARWNHVRWDAGLLLTVGLAAALGGCSSIVTPIVSTITVPSAIRNSIDSTTNFGDSITCGVGAQPSTDGYASVLDTGIGAPSENYCRLGDQAADMARLWIPNAAPQSGLHQVYTVLIGINDANSCGGSSGCLANWYQSLEASLVWLALPSSDKEPATSATSRVGTWTADLGTGLSTTNAGASLSFSVNQAVAGHGLYVAYRVFDGSAANPGIASVAVDGQYAGSVSSAAGTGHAIATGNGTTDTIFVTRIALGAVGRHSVTVTTTSPDGAVFSLQWIGVSGGNYVGDAGAPHVVAGGITSSSSASLNPTIAAYNEQYAGLIAALTADGMNISVAPTDTALNPSTDFSDTLHPNDQGHLKIAEAFAGAL